MNNVIYAIVNVVLNAAEANGLEIRGSVAGFSVGNIMPSAPDL